jgi:hypothetical protein
LGHFQIFSFSLNIPGTYSGPRSARAGGPGNLPKKLITIRVVNKSLPNGTPPIYLRITIGDDRVELSTKKYVLPQRLNQAMQKVSGTGEEAKI